MEPFRWVSDRINGKVKDGAQTNPKVARDFPYAR